MSSVLLSKPELGLVAVTRGLLGLGIGLLASSRLSGSTRRIVGWTLFAIGAASTVPLLAMVTRRNVHSEA